MAAVVATGIGKFVFGDLLPFDLAFVVVACIGWVVYIILRFRWNRNVLDRWGFSFSRFWKSAGATAPFAAVGFGFCIVFGVFGTQSVVNWNLVAALVLYPIWGLIQQFLLVALLADNLRELSHDRVGEFSVVALSAVLFAAVHVPSVPLIVATTFLGGVTTAIFFRYRCIWTAGIFHGWFATLFYYLVMGEDAVRTLVGIPLGL